MEKARDGVRLWTPGYWQRKGLGAWTPQSQVMRGLGAGTAGPWERKELRAWALGPGRGAGGLDNQIPGEEGVWGLGPH